MTYWFDPDQLLPFGYEKRAEYTGADPFPHIVIENFLPADRVNAILEQGVVTLTCLRLRVQ